MAHKIGFCVETRPENCALVLFGATGDLCARKIIPGLFKLHTSGLLPKKFYILATARTANTTESFRDRVAGLLKAAFPRSGGKIDTFLPLLCYVTADYDSRDFYVRLSAELERLDAANGIEPKRLFYFATPPSAFLNIAARLKAEKLIYSDSDAGRWSRILVEKPYGYDLGSAIALDRELRRSATESQIYRVDHFLAKETVQNIIALRTLNTIVDATWNADFIDNVQITMFEELGLEGRAGYFDSMGVAKDMLSHVFQLISVVASEPASGTADFRQQRRELESFIRPLSPEEIPGATVRAQYAAAPEQGRRGYRDEPGIEAGSMTETFFAFRMDLENKRWRGVPFYVRIGKSMKSKRTCVNLEYRKTLSPAAVSGDVMRINIQPRENIELDLITKHPGPKYCYTGRTMKLGYRQHVEEFSAPGDYERLLLDAMSGDQSLFVSSEDLNATWAFITPIEELWRSAPDKLPLRFYPSGSMGPAEADGLLKKDSRRWL